MRDAKISLPRAELLHPAIRQQVIDTITNVEQLSFPETVQIRIVQGLRTIEEQNDLYAKGRTAPGARVTNAKGGSSFHNYGLAIDFALMYDTDGNGTYDTLSWDSVKDFDRDGQKDWQEVVTAFKALGFRWGGDFNSIKDEPHLEKTFGFTWQQLMERYTKKDFISGTRYVRI